MNKKIRIYINIIFGNNSYRHNKNSVIEIHQKKEAFFNKFYWLLRTYS